ncbi:hypothetical protein H5410_035132 [Solanum commersonii]|uniref:Uncharacterized protein n=1 Tax=Solanum commersonii TaxID=4109 RepID=A0A9J5Y3Q6_SOLCO|nr:hypothetical protein H5410_035132 [Solanum commersonii]
MFKRAPKQEKPNFTHFVCYSPCIFGDLGFRLVFGRKFSWFKRAPKQENRFYTNFRVLVYGFLVIQDSVLFLAEIFHGMSIKTLLMAPWFSVIQDLAYFLPKFFMVIR